MFFCTFSEPARRLFGGSLQLKINKKYKSFVTMIDYVLIAVIGAIVSMDTTVFGQFMIAQPLVSSALAGIVLGEPQSVLFIGAIMQLMWLKLIPAGGAIYLNGNLGTLTAVALYELIRPQFLFSEEVLLFTVILSGIAASYIFGYFTVCHRRINGFFIKIAYKALKEKRLSLFQTVHMLGVFSAGIGGPVCLLALVILGKQFLLLIPNVYYLKIEAFSPYGLYSLLGVGLGTVFSMVWIRKGWYYPLVGLFAGALALLIL